MPRYRLYPVSADSPGVAPEAFVAFDDEVALRWATRAAFPLGCDVWLDGRFVGRVHGARGGADEDAP